ncbi:MAG: DUF551 domain-containing protein [Serratia marcescens]|nr:DUF551 domain-containing protein [Serratia marcescens]MDU3647723.1 DUF551 domain-containing protein [Serratia marcescens]
MDDDFKKIICILGEATRALKQTGINVSLAADLEKLTMACNEVAMREDNSQPVAEVRLVDDFCGCCQHPDVEWLGQQGQLFPVGTKFYASQPAPEVTDDWIPCDDRMPEDGDVVLVCQEGGIVYCAEMENGVLYPDEFPRVPTQGKEITHWMPLPSAPQLGGKLSD